MPRQRDMTAEVTETLAQLRAQLDTFTAQRGAERRVASSVESRGGQERQAFSDRPENMVTGSF